MKKRIKKKSTIFQIRNKYIHLLIASYLPKTKVLRIAQTSKKLQDILDITKEDYDIYFLQLKAKERIFNFKGNNQNKNNNYIKSITEITQSSILLQNNIEIKVPITILSILETNSYIVGSTQLKILVYDKNNMSLIKEFDSNSYGAPIKLIYIKDDIIAYSSFLNSIIMYDLKRSKVLNEIKGSSPLLYEKDKLAYIWLNKEIRLISTDAMVYLAEIQLGDIFKSNNEEDNIISYMIKTNNNNILVATWGLTISEYNITHKMCIYTYNLKLEFIDYLYQLKDGRIILLVLDSSKIFIFNKSLYKNDNNNNKKSEIKALSYLTGHNKTVVDIIELDKGQLVSASNDGKIIFWIKDRNNSFCISIVLFLYNNFIRSMIQLYNKRLCVVSDDKVLRIIGLNNKLNDIKIKYIPAKKNNEILGNYFELIDNNYI